jgi:hypothetical protein
MHDIALLQQWIKDTVEGNNPSISDLQLKLKTIKVR